MWLPAGTPGSAPRDSQARACAERQHRRRLRRPDASGFGMRFVNVQCKQPRTGDSFLSIARDSSANAVGRRPRRQWQSSRSGNRRGRAGDASRFHTVCRAHLCRGRVPRARSGAGRSDHDRGAVHGGRCVHESDRRLQGSASAAEGSCRTRHSLGGFGHRRADSIAATRPQGRSEHERP